MTDPRKQINKETEASQIFFKKMIRMGVFRSCYNCVDFQIKEMECKTHKAKPPANVIMFGCDNWVLDIPF